MHTISVVVPAHNCERFLPDALGSIAAQTRVPAEVIVVDDASTDSTASIAAGSGATVIHLPTNGGPAVARNAGIAAARGDVVAFLDGDDVWMPRHLELVGGLLDRFPETLVAFGGVQQFGWRAHFHEAVLPDARPLRLDRLLLGANLLHQSAAIARRSALAAVGGYDETMRYAEDYDLWLRLARHGPFVSTHETTLGYRVHQAQASRQASRMSEGAWRARERAWRALQPSLGDEERAAVAALLLAQWKADMKTAWHYRSREPLATVLALCPDVPGSAEARRRSARRVRWLRRPWLAAAALWDRLPMPLKARMR